MNLTRISKPKSSLEQVWVLYYSTSPCPQIWIYRITLHILENSQNIDHINIVSLEICPSPHIAPLLFFAWIYHFFALILGHMGECERPIGLAEEASIKVPLEKHPIEAPQ